jgi:hypothetical protein
MKGLIWESVRGKLGLHFPPFSFFSLLAERGGWIAERETGGERRAKLLSTSPPHPAQVGHLPLFGRRRSGTFHFTGM